MMDTKRSVFAKASRKRFTVLSPGNVILGAAVLGLAFTAVPNNAQADPDLDKTPSFFGKMVGSLSSGDLDVATQDIDTFQGGFGAALGYKFTNRWNIQLDWNQFTTRNKFNSSNAVTFDSSVFGGKAFYRDPDHFEMGVGYTYGETTAGDLFKGNFHTYNLSGSIFLTPSLTSYGSLGHINGKKDLRDGDGFYLEGGVKYYLNQGLGYNGLDISVGVNAGRIFVDDRSSDAKSLSGYVNFKPHVDVPITFGTSLDYTEFSNSDSFSVTGRVEFHFGTNLWSDTKLVDLDRNNSVMTQPNILLQYYTTERIRW